MGIRIKLLDILNGFMPHSRNEDKHFKTIRSYSLIFLLGC